MTVESGTYAIGNTEGKYVIGMVTMSTPEDGVISLTINGGEFISEGNLVLTGSNNGVPYGSPVINAGIFYENPEAYVNAETSEITPKDGKYIVTLK